MPCHLAGHFLFRTILMNRSFVPTPICVKQSTTGRSFTLYPAEAGHWKGEWPTERTGDVFVSEAKGTVEGSIFAYWLGNKSVESPGVLPAIQTHMDDHDVVCVRVIHAFPDDAHPSLRKDLAELKAQASYATVKQPAFMDLLAQAEAIGVNGQVIVRDWQTGLWTGAPDNEVVHFDYKLHDITHYIILTEEGIGQGIIDSRSQFLGVDHEGTSLSIQFYQLGPLSTKDLVAPIKGATAQADDTSTAASEAIAVVDGHLNNAGLPTYSALLDTRSWKPIADAPKDRYLLGREPGLKRPFVMIWNVPDQQFEVLHGMGDESPTEFMELPGI
jgi:hypothetical protein